MMKPARDEKAERIIIKKHSKATSNGMLLF
jgi:hypothetical protein